MRFLSPAMTFALALSAIGACSGITSQEAGSSGSGGAASSTTATSTTSSSSAANSTTSSSTSSSSAASSTTSSSTTSSSAASTSSSGSSSSGAGGGLPGLLAELKAGPWLIGWPGGLDHFSWVRFNFVSATQGSVDVLDAKCVSCIGYWLCEGKGIFSVDPMTSTVILQLPQGCNNQAHTLVFTMFMQPGPFPPKATLEASLTDDGIARTGFQYPPAQCDAQFTMCGDPFQ